MLSSIDVDANIVIINFIVTILGVNGPLDRESETEMQNFRENHLRESNARSIIFMD